jgi:hypothetical protein
VSAGAAQTWFVAGTVPLIVAGALHVVYALVDTVRPRYFAPRERSVMRAMEGTTIRLRRGEQTTPSVWSVWIGVHIGFGLGLLTFGLLCLLIALHDFALVESIAAIRPLTIAFCAAYLALSLRFFWYVQVIITGAATACFVVAAVLSA